MSKNTLIVIGFLVLSLAIAGSAIMLRQQAQVTAPPPIVVPVNQIPLDEVFAEAATNPAFVQVTLYSIDSTSDAFTSGNGRIRYSDGKQIYGYSGGRNGAVVSVIFEDKASEAYKICANVFKSAIPMGREVFISGEGSQQTAPPTTMSGAARVVFNKVKHCGLITHRR